MADEADITQDRLEREQVLLQRAEPYRLAEGVPGDCELCGEESKRLVHGACARCRDRRGLP